MIKMAHKTIMIQEDVYEMLETLKGTDRSFNDVIKALILRNCSECLISLLRISAMTFAHITPELK